MLSRLHEKCLSCVVITAPAHLETTTIFNVVAKKNPSWLYYSEASYRLHLSQLSVLTLAAAVKLCLQLGGRQIRDLKKESCVSKIVDNFVLEHDAYISASRDNFSVNISSFVHHMEVLYGEDIAMLLRETPFTISLHTNHDLNFSKDSELSWFNETVEELVWRLNSFPIQCIISHINKIPGHRRPIYNPSRSHRKILNTLADHVLQRVSYLFNLKFGFICEIVLAFDPGIVFAEDPSKESLINSVI